MKTRLIAFVLFLPGFVGLSAQTQITGQVYDVGNQPLIGATIALFHATDSQLVKGAIADIDGRFRIENIVPGVYFVEANMLGYDSNMSEPFTLLQVSGVKALGTIVLQEGTAQLSEVTVVARKQLFEQKIDRLVINVENTITSVGGTALEVLERAPGVQVDRQGNAISLAGKSGVQIMINGKIKYVPISSMVQMLGGMSADNIEKIEIITTPPAHLDAEGNAGYINIVLKTDLNEGIGGSCTFSAGYGFGLVGSAAAHFNYRSGKLNLYGDYSYFHDGRGRKWIFTRAFDFEGKAIATSTVTEAMSPDADDQFGRLGLDYQLSKKTVFGTLLSAYQTNWKMDAVNRSDIRINGATDTLLNIQNYEFHRMRHFAVNVNLQHHFTPDESIGVDFDYLDYYDINPSDYTNRYADGQDRFLFETRTRTDKITPIGITVGKADYSKTWGGNVKMEAGIKAVRSTFTNDVHVDIFHDPDWQADPELTGKYNLLEQIAAAYTAWDLKVSPKTDLKLGLRYEYTDSNLGSVEEPDIIDRKYGNLFPSVFVNHQINDQNSVNLSYSRRITRPTFNEMAPFVLFIDPNLFFTGNAALQPAISDNIAISYRHKSVLLTLQYSYDDDAMARFQSRFDPERNRQLLVSENMNYLKSLNLTLNFPVEVTRWWEMQWNLSGYGQELNAPFEGQELTHRLASYNLNLANRFTFGSGFSGELIGSYQSATLWGIYRNLPIYQINAGLQKKFGDRGGTLSLSINDVFNLHVLRVNADLPDQGLSGSARVDFSRSTFRLSYSRPFGSQGVKAMRNRAEVEEKKRVG